MVAIAKTPAVLSSEILIKSSGYKGHFILLEGDFDQRFWMSRLSSIHLKPINCVGKPNLLDTLDLLILKNQAHKIVALADKDYDEILLRLRSFAPLVYTDENDLEITLLRSPSGVVGSVMERILSESVDGSKLLLFEEDVGHSVVEHIRRMASNYGVLRLVNEQLQSGVDFDALPIRHNRFLDHATLQQNQSVLQKDFIDAVNRVGKVQITELDLLEIIEMYRARGLFSGWALVQGHDLMQLLALAINSTKLKHNSGHRQASEESLARDLCLMIHRNALQTKTMYQRLIAHGGLAGLEFFL